MSGFLIQQIGWVQIPGPTLAIDTTDFVEGGPYVANIRSDDGFISIWQRSNGGSWQTWTPARGWSGVHTFPADFAGPVGWIPPQNAASQVFYTAQYTTTPNGVPAVRAVAIGPSGYVGNQGWWPPKSIWNIDVPPYGYPHSVMNIAFGGTLFQVSPEQDALDSTIASAFVTPYDQYHLWLFNNYNPVSYIGSSLLAFNPMSGTIDYGIFLDLTAGNYTQNYGRPLALYTGDGVNTMVCSPSAQMPFQDLTYSAPFNAYPERVISFHDFIPSGFGGSAEPIFTSSADNTNAFPPANNVRVRPTNFENTVYFPNVGVPGYAWTNAPALTGIQVQMRGACFVNPFYGTSPSGIMDQFATVSPLNISDMSNPDYPNIFGIIYAEYWQGFMGLPIGIAFPAAAVAPFYIMLHNGGVYILDSNTPTQMFELAFLSSTYAGLYAGDNWVMTV